MKRPSLLVIFLTVFIDLIGFGIVMPLLPLYSQRFGASGVTIGLIIASFSVMQFLFSPYWGRLSDRIGRRPVLLISLAGGAIAYGIFTWASALGGRHGLWLLLLSRGFAGACGGNINVVQAYIADITPPEQRSARMGLVGMAFGLGFIFGPLLGGLSRPYGLAAPGWVAVALCTANFLLACLVLPESRRPSSDHVPPRPRISQWTHTLAQPGVGLLIGLFFLATFCFACYETTLALLVEHTFHFDEVHVSYLFAFSGVLSALIQGGLIRRLVHRLGEPRLIAVSFAVIGASLIGLPFARSLPALLGALALLALGSGINRPPIFGLISMFTSEREQGANLGVAQSAGSLARILGPLFASGLFEWHPTLPYLLCGGVALASGFLASHRLRHAFLRRDPPPSD